MPSRDFDFDDALYAPLRAVPLPENFLARLRQAALVDDAGLDAAPSNVVVPQGFSERLRQAVRNAHEGRPAAVGGVRRAPHVSESPQEQLRRRE